MSNASHFLVTVYEQCNEHLREQSKKRDQVIAFYLVVLSFYFGSYSTLNRLLDGPYTQILFNIVIVCISGMTIRTLSGLRSWHIQYINAALTLNYLLIRNIDSTEEINRVTRIFNYMARRKMQKVTSRKIFSGVENRVILALIFISGFPMVMLVKEISSLLKPQGDISVFLIEIILYFLYTLYYIKNTVIVIKKSVENKTWIVQFGK